MIFLARGAFLPMSFVFIRNRQYSACQVFYDQTVIKPYPPISPLEQGFPDHGDTSFRGVIR
jgi:hypothetical protein